MDFKGLDRLILDSIYIPNSKFSIAIQVIISWKIPVSKEAENIIFIDL